MKIYDIDQLGKSDNGLYDLTKLTFKTKFEGISYGDYVVQKGENMRIDLVCYSIYNNVDNIDILLNVNNISNPLNIKEGTIIKYPNLSSIDEFKVINTNSTSVQKSLSNVNKSTTNDSTRQSYVDQNYSLPPTVLDSPVKQTSVDGNTVKIGTGLFNK